MKKPSQKVNRQSDNHQYEEDEDESYESNDSDDTSSESQMSDSGDSISETEIKELRHRQTEINKLPPRQTEINKLAPRQTEINKLRPRQTKINKLSHSVTSKKNISSRISNKLSVSNNVDANAKFKNNRKRNAIVGVILAIVTGVVLYMKFPVKIGGLLNGINRQESLNDMDAIEYFSAEIDNIKNRFKKQKLEVWDEIYAGVVDIVKHPKKRTIVFLFSDNEDPMVCLAKMIGNASRIALNTDVLNLEPSILGNNYGEVIETYGKKIEEKKIVIVDDLLNINTEALRAFHNFCDSENPLVNRTMYIITMTANGYRKNERPIDFVEKKLKHRLEGKINTDKILPLIARITDAAIIPVEPEPDIKSCPLRYSET